jgi:hypothetical protein
MGNEGFLQRKRDKLYKLAEFSGKPNNSSPGRGCFLSPLTWAGAYLMPQTRRIEGLARNPPPGPREPACLKKVLTPGYKYLTGTRYFAPFRAGL